LLLLEAFFFERKCRKLLLLVKAPLLVALIWFIPQNSVHSKRII
jgi:hypothetical protein